MTTATLPVYTKKIFRPTRKSAGARAAAITRSFPPCRPSSPSWDSPRKIRGGFRHRLLQPLPVLHEHFRFPHHSRPRARHRHRRKIARPDLEVWVATGDGDSLSIGGNHTIHMLRRNVGLKVLMFNNKIYGLTKGQYSPTSEIGKKTKSTPFGTADRPFNPLSLAIGSEATFVARSVDVFQQHLKETLQKSGGPSRLRLHRDTAKLQHFQRRRVGNDHRKRSPQRTSRPARTRQAAHLRQEPRQRNSSQRPRSGSGPARKRHHRKRFAGPRRAQSASGLCFPAVAHGAHARLPHPHRRPPRAGRCPALRRCDPTQIREVQARRGKGDLAKLLRAGDTWEVKA